MCGEQYLYWHYSAKYGNILPIVVLTREVAVDLSNPISSVIPGAYGEVLAVLARSGEWLSGRKVAALTRGQTSRRRVDAILAELARAGIADLREVPPAKTYRLNREHVAAVAIESLALLWENLLARLRDELDSWALQPEAAWVFGSASRREGNLSSDIDLALIKPGGLEGRDDDLWMTQVDALRESVRSWSGNELEVFSVTTAQLRRLREDGERLVDELRADAIVVIGPSVHDLLAARR